MSDFLALFIAPPDSSLIYTGVYDLLLVTMSLVVAVLASYAALLVSQSLAQPLAGQTRRWWLLAGSACLGLGIWAMHFIGMLAFSLPCSTGFDQSLTVLSVLPSILASAMALQIISRPSIATPQLALGGLLMGLGIGAMHYIGMAGMRLEGLVRYQLGWVLVSLVLAVGLSTLAIWIKFRLQLWVSGGRQWSLPLSALTLGCAVSAMHYTAMAAAYFIREGDISAVDSVLAPSFLALIVLAVALMVIILTVVATYVAKPKLRSMKQSYKIIAALILGWMLTSWVIAERYTDHQLSTLYDKSVAETTRRVSNETVLMDESLQLLKAIPLMYLHSADVHLNLRRFGADAAVSTLPFATRQQSWTDDAELQELSRTLLVAALQFKADVIWLVNAAGDCVASSNYGDPDSFVGTNYAAREYFLQAKAGFAGHQYALGMKTRLPGLFYSQPVLDQGRFVGTVVVKRNLSSLASWVGQAHAFVSDANGVIVLAADKSLEFKYLPDAKVTQFAPEAIQMQYGLSRLEALSIRPWGDARMPHAVRLGQSPHPVVLATHSLADGLLTIHVTQPITEWSRLTYEKWGFFVLITAVGGLLVVTAFAMVLYLREMRRVEADLRVSATAFESQEAMVITNYKNVILRCNPSFLEQTGYSADELVGKTPDLLKSERHTPEFYADLIKTLLQTGSWQGELWIRRKSGESYPSFQTITGVKGVRGWVTHFVGMHTDITERKASEAAIQQLAFYDPLTQLPNRRLMMDRLNHALANSARNGLYGALFFIDLDNFKTLNDTRGHDQGDKLLQLVAQRLKACMREEDTVARLGGDEFVVMLEGVNESVAEAANQVRTVGEKILAALNYPYQLNATDYRSTPSMGVTLFAGHQDSVDELLKRADVAMYQAKAAGRNTLRFFDPAMQASVMARANLEIELREGLAKGQFLLHYQVQVNGQGSPVGCEALVRWHHPKRGLLPPADFIAVAEETGLIVSLGKWVLQNACQQLLAWSQIPGAAHLVVAVNISARQFRQTDFVDMVLQVIEATGANAHQLKLEVTESLLLDDVEGLITKMNSLKAKGVRFSLDDFGTGYCSLAYLKRLPLDEVKIDQSFVRDVLIDENDAAIVCAIITLARSMNLEVIAEGVQTKEQRRFLDQQGCRYYQGFLFGTPTPPDVLVSDLIQNAWQQSAPQAFN
jgi:diguanylate cyclase (GGDEF)-like protein/PAS domain S-box-containing protein